MSKSPGRDFQTYIFLYCHLDSPLYGACSPSVLTEPLKEICYNLPAYSVQFSYPVVSNSLWPHGLQYARFPCPSPIPGAYSNSCPSSRWCHPPISSSAIPLFSCLQSFPASGSFPMSQFFASGCQSIRASVSASVLPVNIQDWFFLGLTPCSSRYSQESSATPQVKSINSLALSFIWSSSHIHTWLIEKPQLWYVCVYIHRKLYTSILNEYVYKYTHAVI